MMRPMGSRSVFAGAGPVPVVADIKPIIFRLQVRGRAIRVTSSYHAADGKRSAVNEITPGDGAIETEFFISRLCHAGQYTASGGRSGLGPILL